jgi:AraC-like DNA-binding protein
MTRRLAGAQDHCLKRASSAPPRGLATALAGITYDCGYYHQPHMNREFRELAGTTPTDFLAHRLPDRETVGDGIT